MGMGRPHIARLAHKYLIPSPPFVVRVRSPPEPCSCLECRFFDDDTSKQQFHCEKCGICRVGGRENFFHCDRCGCCYNASLKHNHICVERSLHQDCPVCAEVRRASCMRHLHLLRTAVRLARPLIPHEWPARGVPSERGVTGAETMNAAALVC